MSATLPDNVQSVSGSISAQPGRYERGLPEAALPYLTESKKSSDDHESDKGVFDE
jgi:hypothetical protein